MEILSLSAMQKRCEHTPFLDRLPSNQRKAVCRICHVQLERGAREWRVVMVRPDPPRFNSPYVPPKTDEDQVAPHS